MKTKPFGRVNWPALEQVKRLADDLARDARGCLLVIKREGQAAYDLVPRSRRAIWRKPDITVIYETEVK